MKPMSPEQLTAAVEHCRTHDESVRDKYEQAIVQLADRLVDAQRNAAACNESISRLTTIVDEAFGMQPVMSTENLLTFLERSLYERRVAAEDAQRNAAQAVGRVRELEGERGDVLGFLELAMLSGPARAADQQAVIDAGNGTAKWMVELSRKARALHARLTASAAGK